MKKDKLIEYFLRVYENILYKEIYNETLVEN